MATDKPSETFLMFLTGGEARTQSGNHDFLWTIDHMLLNNLRGVNVALKWIQIPHTIPPIRSGVNTIKYTDGTSDYTYTIPEANYTGTQIAAVLETEFQAQLAGTYAVAFDSQTQRITVTIPNGNTFGFLPVDDDAYRELGVTDTSTEYTASGSDVDLEFGQTVYLLGPSVVEIHSSIATNNYTTRKRRNVLDIFPVESGFGSLLQYRKTEDDWSWVPRSHFHHITCRLYDGRGTAFTVPEALQDELLVCLKVTPVHSAKRPHAILGDSEPGSLYQPSPGQVNRY